MTVVIPTVCSQPYADDRMHYEDQVLHNKIINRLRHNDRKGNYTIRTYEAHVKQFHVHFLLRDIEQRERRQTVSRVLRTGKKEKDAYSYAR